MSANAVDSLLTKPSEYWPRRPWTQNHQFSWQTLALTPSKAHGKPETHQMEAADDDPLMSIEWEEESASKDLFCPH